MCGGPGSARPSTASDLSIKDERGEKLKLSCDAAAELVVVDAESFAPTGHRWPTSASVLRREN